jgi:hypothetical protein
MKGFVGYIEKSIYGRMLSRLCCVVEYQNSLTAFGGGPPTVLVKRLMKLSTRSPFMASYKSVCITVQYG